MGMGLGLVMSLAGTAVSAMGSIQAGNAESAMYAYQAAVARQNANFAAAEGEAKGADVGIKGAATVAATEAQIAARGVDVTRGSSVAVVDSARRLALLDATTVRSDAARESYGYTTQATELDFSSKQAKTAGYIGAAGAIFKGIGGLTGYLPGGGFGGAAMSSPGGFAPMGSLIGGPISAADPYYTSSNGYVY